MKASHLTKKTLSDRSQVDNSKAHALFAALLYKNIHSRAWFLHGRLIYQEIKVCFFQFYSIYYPFFSLYHCLNNLISSLIRILLGKSINYSFSHTGEDLIIESILKPRLNKSGCYIDVGCNHPIHLSNSYMFYRKGWRGICVDPNEHLIRLHKKYRPRDHAICTLVSNTEIERNFYSVQNDVLSTTETLFLEEYVSLGMDIETSVVKPRTLQSILKQCNAPKFIDFLSIDAEEHDFQVLQSVDLNEFCFGLILVEDETFNPEDPASNPIFAYLTSRAYRLEGYILKNLYFTSPIEFRSTIVK